ncbi:MAG TPA: hypothetical protein VIY48_04125, partial [Candidatus Paceibacterota bacterium]
PDMLRHVIVAGKSARTAALELCYSAAAYILLVNHFLDTKSEGYMTKADAIEYLQKQIAEQAGVKGGMLNLYIRNASTLAGVLTGSLKMFGPTIIQLAKAETPADMVHILSKFMDENNAKRVDSMSALSEALGYKTSRPTGAAERELTPEKAVTKASNAMKSIEKIVGTGKGKVSETKIAQAVVSQVKSALIFAREAIKSITEEDDLKAIEAAVKEQRATLKRLSTQAKDTVAARIDNNTKLPGQRKHDKTGRSVGATRTQA